MEVGGVGPRDRIEVRRQVLVEEFADSRGEVPGVLPRPMIRTEEGWLEHMHGSKPRQSACMHGMGYIHTPFTTGTPTIDPREKERKKEMF